MSITNLKDYLSIIIEEVLAKLTIIEEKIANLTINGEKCAKLIINAEELAKLLNVHPVTIRKWVASNKIPYYRIGSAIRFNLDEVLEATRSAEQGGAR